VVCAISEAIVKKENTICCLFENLELNKTNSKGYGVLNTHRDEPAVSSNKFYA
jgi:hypothetical protein